MKKQKMSLEKMRGVLSNVLSREEMKEVMAGSGPTPSCSGLRCSPVGGYELGNCVYYSGMAPNCRCSGNPLYYWC